MNTKLLLSWALCLALPAAAGAAAVSRDGWQSTDAEHGKWFLSLDLPDTGTFDHGPRQDSDGNAAGFTAAGFAADSSWHTTGGAGVRLGYLRALTKELDLGGSVGFMGGPGFDDTFAASKAGQSVSWSDQGDETYVRLMLEPQWHRALNDRWSVHVQGAAGLSLGWQNETFHCSASGMACPRPLGDSSSFTPGISWELGPAVSYKSWLLWLGIAGFPRSGGSQMVAVPAWRAFQLALKYTP